MPLDTSIPLQVRGPEFQDPMAIQAKRMQLADLMGQQQMRQMQMEDAKRQRQEQQTLADLYRESGGDAVKTRGLLAQRGFGAKIPEFDKAQATIEKERAGVDKVKLENAKVRLEVAGGALSSLLANPNVQPQDVIQAVQGLVQNRIMDEAEGAQFVRTLPPDSGSLRNVLMQHGLKVMDASKRVDLLLGSTEVRNMGGRDQVFTTNRLTNTVTPGQSFERTASQEAILADKRAREEGAASRAVQMRGQNMSDARAKEALQYGRIPAGYRQKADGTLEAIPGGPAAAAVGSTTAKVNDANEAIALINQAEPLLKGSTGSYSGVALDTLAAAFGAATPGAINAQKLKAIEGALVAKMPKMSGPQSDKDVALYRQMAASIGDPTIPYAQKAAALDSVREIQERYAGMPTGASKPKPLAKDPAPGGFATDANGWSIQKVGP